MCFDLCTEQEEEKGRPHHTFSTVGRRESLTDRWVMRCNTHRGVDHRRSGVDARNVCVHTAKH